MGGWVAGEARTSARRARWAFIALRGSEFDLVVISLRLCRSTRILVSTLAAVIQRMVLTVSDLWPSHPFLDPFPSHLLGLGRHTKALDHVRKA